MSYYPGSDSNIRDKVKVALDLSSYDTKSDFIGLKAEVDKLGIDKLVNVPTSLNNQKPTVGG